MPHCLPSGFPGYLDSLCQCTAAMRSFQDVCLVSSEPGLLGYILLDSPAISPQMVPVSSPASGTLPAAPSCMRLLGNLPHAHLAGREGLRDLHHAESTASPLPGACLCCSAGAAGGVRGVTAAVSSAPQTPGTSSRPVWAAAVGLSGMAGMRDRWLQPWMPLREGGEKEGATQTCQSRAQNVLPVCKNPCHSPKDGGALGDRQGRSAVGGLQRQNGLKG